MTKVTLLVLIISMAVWAQETPQKPELNLSETSIERIGSGGFENVFLSMLIPGLGEWRSGNKRMAKIFFGTELALWIGYISTEAYISNLQEDMESLAALYAGVNTADKDDQYWIDIGSSLSIYQFNADRLLARDLQGGYEEGGEHDWEWESDERRKEYFARRLNRQDWKRTSTVVVGGIVLNHLISAIDVVRILRGQAALDDERQSMLHMDYKRDIIQGESVRLNLTMFF